MADWTLDQASGLRRLLRRSGGRATVLLAPTDDSAVPSIIARCARELAALGTPVATLRLTPRSGPDYLQRLMLAHEVLLLDGSGLPPPPMLGEAGSGLGGWLVLRMDPAALTLAYSWIKRHAVALTGCTLGVLAVGGRDGIAGKAAVANLAGLAASQLGLELSFVAWLPERAVVAPPGGAGDATVRPLQRSWQRIARALKERPRPTGDELPRHVDRPLGAAHSHHQPVWRA